MNRDELIGDIARLIISDAKVIEKPWDGYALIAWYGDGFHKLNGFRFVAGEPGEAATPTGFDIEDRFEQLRKVMQTQAKGVWRVCIFRIHREASEVAIDFEYEDPGQWYVTSDTAAAIAERVRP